MRNWDYSLIAVVDTDKSEHIGDIRIEGGTMERNAARKIKSAASSLLTAKKNRIEVLDRKKRTILTSWPITLGKGSCRIGD